MTVDKLTICFITTNQNKLGNLRDDTGYDLREFAHMYHEITSTFPEAEVDIATPNGGKAPMDSTSFKKGVVEGKDPICMEFLANVKVQLKMNNTKKVADLNPEEYDAVVFPGGHGPMFDLPQCDAVQNFAVKVYDEQNGVVGCICHGSAGFVHAKTSKGDWWVSGRKLTCWPDKGERQMGVDKEMPFLLESKLREHGATVSTARGSVEDSCVIVDDRLVSGQNPASANETAQKICRVIKDMKHRR